MNIFDYNKLYEIGILILKKQDKEKVQKYP